MREKNLIFILWGIFLCGQIPTIFAEEDPRLYKIDCPKVISEGIEDPNNVFTCLKNETCCTVDLQPACCAQKPMVDAM